MKLLATKRQIEDHIDVVSSYIYNDYAHRDFTALIVLKGGIPFGMDLLKKSGLDCQIEYVTISSYYNNKRSDKVKIDNLNLEKFTNKPVLIIDDILDTGHTLNTLRNLVCKVTHDIKICCLLDKPSKHQVEVKLDYYSIKIPDYFVYGYGMDKNGLYRNLEEIYYD